MLNVVEHLTHDKVGDEMSVRAVTVEDAEDSGVAVDDAEEVVLADVGELTLLRREAQVLVVE